MPRQRRSPITLTLSYFVSEIRSFWRNAMTFEVGVAEMPLRLCVSSYILSGEEIFSNTDLINKVPRLSSVKCARRPTENPFMRLKLLAATQSIVHKQLALTLVRWWSDDELPALVLLRLLLQSPRVVRWFGGVWFAMLHRSAPVSNFKTRPPFPHTSS
jgi:hypothetical protein